MEEYVKKQDVIDVFNILADKMDATGQVVMQQAVDIVKDVVPADVRENVHGEWVVINGELVCSKCHGHYSLVGRNFCSNCGTDMRKKDKED